MLFGVFPYMGRNDNELLNNIKNKGLNLQPNQIRISDNMKDLLSKMICYSREKRIKWHEVYRHPIFTEEKKDNSINVSLAHLHSSRIQIKENRNFYDQKMQGFYNNNKEFD